MAMDLSHLDEAYRRAEVEDRDEVPDGRYQTKIDKVEIRESKRTGNRFLSWTLKILGPNHRGRLLFRNNMLESEDNMKWLKGDLQTCGLQLGKLSELPQRLHELLDVQLEVVAKTKGENQNVYLQKRIQIDEDGDGTETGHGF